MALSVLSININKGLFGLYDSNEEKFVMSGTSQEMYKLKHEIEDAEQQEDNKKYLEDLVIRYKKMFESIKMLENDNSQNIQLKIDLFNKYLGNK